MATHRSHTPAPATSTRRARRAGATSRAVVLAVVFAVILAVLAAVVLVAGGTLRLDSLLHALSQGDLRGLRSQLRGLGALAAVALVVLALAHTVLPFPAELLAAAGGFALGAAAAVPVLLVGLLLSALVAYAIGLRLGRPLAARLVGSRRLTVAERFVDRAGARGLLAVRLFPLLPFSPVCLACGIAEVPLRRFVWTTVLGMLPEVALVAYLGSRLQSFSLTDPRVFAPLAGMLMLLVLGPALLRLSGRER